MARMRDMLACVAAWTAAAPAGAASVFVATAQTSLTLVTIEGSSPTALFFDVDPLADVPLELESGRAEAMASATAVEETAGSRLEVSASGAAFGHPFGESVALAFADDVILIRNDSEAALTLGFELFYSLDVMAGAVLPFFEQSATSASVLLTSFARGEIFSLQLFADSFFPGDAAVSAAFSFDIELGPDEGDLLSLSVLAEGDAVSFAAVPLPPAVALLALAIAALGAVHGSRRLTAPAST